MFHLTDRGPVSRLTQRGCFSRSPLTKGGIKGGFPVRFDYLRWKDDGTPAAGAFEGWPRTLKEFTMLDPCCGSGHFLVAGFHLLVPLRRHDEGLSAADAIDAVLRENLHGLELDPRCTQIAAFALAMAAWKYPGEDGNALGYRPLPPLNIACSGQGVVGSKADWVKFANGDKNFVAAMGFLYDEFVRAPTLGSLINPRAIAESIFRTGFDPLRGSLDRALRKTETQADPDRAAVGVAAQGIAVAASLMARQFTPSLPPMSPAVPRSRQAGRDNADVPRRCAFGGEGGPGDGVRRAVPGVLCGGRIDGPRDAAELAPARVI